jgi:type II secretory pathway pseudopilin PulG
MFHTAHLRSSLMPCAAFGEKAYDNDNQPGMLIASKYEGNRCVSSHGDTLVEVLMAIVVLSMVIVGAITIMSRGLKASELAVEHTQVRFQINAQTQLLRYLRDGYSSDPASAEGQAWASLFSGATVYADTTASNYNDAACGMTSGKIGFYLTQSGGNVVVNRFDDTVKPATYALPGQGLWIEMTRSSGISPAYVDVMFRACWSGIGDSTDQQAVTVLRLYDPAH